MSVQNLSVKKRIIDESLGLLQALIGIPSFSREEEKTAALISRFFSSRNIAWERKGNNIWAKTHSWKKGAPVILLISHHDTVKPSSSYTRDPFDAGIEDGRLFGLGSNDAGGSLAAMIAAFLHLNENEDLPFNIILAAVAEEEISGENGVSSILSALGHVDFAIVGEPTGMQMAIAEKGLLVLDCEAVGTRSHVAHGSGDNAIYKALQDIEWFRIYRFPKVSELLGPVRMSVTEIASGSQHNVIPDLCRFTVDIRLTDEYTHEEIIAKIKKNVKSAVIPRSQKLRSSYVSPDHPAVQAGLSLGLETYGSPTLSDMALLPFPAMKLGPGDSARSHMADEFIYIDEIENAAGIYVDLLLNIELPDVIITDIQ